MVDHVSREEKGGEKYCTSIDRANKLKFFLVYGYTPEGKLYIEMEKLKEWQTGKSPILWMIFGDRRRHCCGGAIGLL